MTKHEKNILVFAANEYYRNQNEGAHVISCKFVHRNKTKSQANVQTADIM